MYKLSNIAVFPSFKNLPIKHGFSWGETTKNMSESFDDPSVVAKRVNSFLKTLEMSIHPNVVKIQPDNPFNDPNKMEITKATLLRGNNEAGNVLVGANFIYTFDPSIAIIIEPGDCPCSILFGQDRDGRNFVGIVHSSAAEVNKLTPKKAVDCLKSRHGADPKEIKIGISPGISKDYYFIKDSDGFDLNNWKGFAQEKLEKGQKRFYLDLQGNTIKQYEDEGVVPSNIEVYKVDTFESALEGKTFSHRLSTVLNSPDGRYILACQLN